MHDIRLATLFTQERHPGVVYDESHPLDLDPNNQPFLLTLDGAPIGVVRLDDRGSEVWSGSSRSCQSYRDADMAGCSAALWRKKRGGAA